MKLALIACAATLLAAGCATPSVNATGVSSQVAAERDRNTAASRQAAYQRAEQPGWAEQPQPQN